MTDERFSLKDHLFNKAKVSYLGDLLDGAVHGFDRRSFEGVVMARLPDLELKQRIAMIAEVLAEHLDRDFKTAASQIQVALPPPLDPTLGDDDFGDFIFAPFGKFVEDRGSDHYETSMALLKELTMRFSMEGSVRPFIDLRPEDTLRLFESWARDDNYHVRRLVSESTRPRLPWSPRISLTVDQPLPLLDILHADPTRYVTRSVANHLNDISKIEPDLALARLARWRDTGSQTPAELDWMTTHALRSLIKDGDPDALAVLGYSPDPQVEADAIHLGTPVVRGGEALEFSISISAVAPERLMVDYVIDFVKKDGATRPKVFKLKKLSMDRADSTTLSKTHRLRTDATTYSLYAGTHGLSVVINGQVVQSTEFEVKTD